MNRLLILFVFCFSTSLFSQKVSGTVSDEDQNPIPAVLVFNMKTEQKIYTNLNGEFSIEASTNDELRFIRKGYERSYRIVKQNDFITPLRINIIRIAEEIEEVQIVYQPTGDLEKDVKNFGDTKSVAKLKSETVKYIRSESAPEVLASKPGEFVQPVGSGFFVGGPENQWDDVDFTQFLIENLGNEFFTTELMLTNSEIQPFIYYIFRNFERKDILFRGAASTADLSRFINESYKKLEPYRKNLPNDPPKKKKRK